MNSDDYRDRLVDMLLRERVGKETPPDVRDRVLEAAGDPPNPQALATSGDPFLSQVLKPAAEPSGPLASQPKPVPMLRSLQKSQSSKAPMVAIAATVVLLVVAGVLVHSQRKSAASNPVLTSVTGTVNRAPGPIRPGEKLSTGADSIAVITYRDGSVVRLSAQTTLVVSARSSRDGSKGIELVAGEVRAAVAPQRPDRGMILASKDARAEVVGTKLALRCDAQGTRLEVSDGAVRFVPVADGSAAMVKSGFFAEAGRSGFRTGLIKHGPVRGITGFTLMNAETDQPMREKQLVDGETLYLSLLPTRKISIRADFAGTPPAIVRFHLSRKDGRDNGLVPAASADQKHPPFFINGDYWPEGRPNDCRPWTPRPGAYEIIAEAVFAADEDGEAAKPLKIGFRITD